MKNDNVLISFINENLILTEEELAYVFDLFEYKTYKKGEQIKGIDEVCAYTYLLLEGVVRQFQTFKNKEVSEQFFFQNAFFSEYQSFTKQAISKRILVAKEDVKLYQISYVNLQLIYERIPRFQNLIRKMLEENLNFIMELNSMIVNDSPEVRYLKLKEIRPEVIQEIPQYMIATFLGMTAEALSRLKGRLARARFEQGPKKDPKNLPN
jgi:signal-transduction protein with cAMP-binding, CBS, and nucleotidyltransferase domain